MAHWADIGGKTRRAAGARIQPIFIRKGLSSSTTSSMKRGKLNQTFLRFHLEERPLSGFGSRGFERHGGRLPHGQPSRYIALCQRYGADVIQGAMEQVFDQSEAMMRAKIGEIPDGAYSASVMMDHDGVELDKPYQLAVTVTVSGDEMNIDWAGSADTVKGPTNHPFVGTTAMAQTVLKSLTMPFDPMNHGHLRPLTVSGAG